MKNKEKYIVIQSLHGNDLEHEANLYIEQGYEPLGGVAVGSRK